MSRTSTLAAAALATAALAVPATALGATQTDPLHQLLGAIVYSPGVEQGVTTVVEGVNNGGELPFAIAQDVEELTLPAPTSHAPMTLPPNWGTLQAANASAPGAGTLRVVSARSARRRVRVHVACVGGKTGCRGTIRVHGRSRRGRTSLVSAPVALASGQTRVYSLRLP